MQNFLTIGFKYCEKLYHSIIMVKKRSDCTVYKITVMNGDLENLLHGNHVIKEVNGCLELEICENNKQEQLKGAIVEALNRILKIPLKKITKQYEKTK